MNRNEVYRVTDYTSGNEYFFCQAACAEGFDGGGNLGDVEDVTEEFLEDARDESWKCDFCRQLIVKGEGI